MNLNIKITICEKWKKYDRAFLLPYTWKRKKKLNKYTVIKSRNHIKDREKANRHTHTHTQRKEGKLEPSSFDMSYVSARVCVRALHIIPGKTHKKQRCLAEVRDVFKAQTYIINIIQTLRHSLCCYYYTNIHFSSSVSKSVLLLPLPLEKEGDQLSRFFFSGIFFPLFLLVWHDECILLQVMFIFCVYLRYGFNGRNIR